MNFTAKRFSAVSKPCRKADHEDFDLDDIVRAKRRRLEATPPMENGSDKFNPRHFDVRKRWIVRHKRSAVKTESQLKSTVDDKKKKASFESLESIAKLGAGAFGKVFLCQDTKASKYSAVKKIEKKPVDKATDRKNVNGPVRENRIMKSITHPFLVSLERSFQNEKNLFFVMDFANGGDLWFHQMDRLEPTYTEEEVRFYAAEITMALGYLHDHGIIYRDLKRENVLMDKEGHVKIADFGLSKDGMTRDDRTETFCGTPEYLAPEVVRRHAYGFSSDWWSLGILVYVMFVGYLPFTSQDVQEVYRLILEDDPEFLVEINWDAEYLIQGLLEKDPERRMGEWEIRRHDFFTNIDWDKLYRREIQPPFVPELDSETDLRYFCNQFTNRKSVQLRSIDSTGVGVYSKDEFEGFDWIGSD